MRAESLHLQTLWLPLRAELPGAFSFNAMCTDNMAVKSGSSLASEEEWPYMVLCGPSWR